MHNKSKSKSRRDREADRVRMYERSKEASKKDLRKQQRVVLDLARKGLLVSPARRHMNSK